MLQAMPQPAPSAPSPASQSFAGLLASFTTPGEKKPPVRDLGRVPLRNQPHDLDGLEDDVATLSYERALRAHARYRAPEGTAEPVPQVAARFPSLAAAEPAVAEPLRIFEAAPAWEAEDAPTAVAQVETIPAAHFAADAELELPAVRDQPAGLDRNLKTSSITIRLSQTECAQLRRRAAEAGLSVSAYLRSCTFETEALRALVKDTLAKMRDDGMRADGEKEHHDAPERDRGGWREFWARIWPYRRVSHRTVEA
jgi:hypothetical protein